MSEQAYAGPTHTWQFFKSKDDGGCHHYLLSFYSLSYWEFSDGCLGVTGRTPWGVIIRWNYWRKNPRADR